jgi:uncharacterized protein (UPF0335 family)
MIIASNTIEGRALALADRIETLQMQIEAEQEACWAEAKGGNLPEKAMRAYIKVRTAQRKAMAKLTDHERLAFEHLRDALGPLGAAAADRAGYASEDTLDVRPRFKQEADDGMTDRPFGAPL